MERRHLPHVTGDLRSHIVTVPEEIWKCSGIVILGRRIKSLVFTTDIAIIRNCNADAVLAVYPFTPQQVISNSIIQASNIPVLCGVGGGLTGGDRTVRLSKDAEAQGASGVVVNAPVGGLACRLGAYCRSESFFVKFFCNSLKSDFVHLIKSDTHTVKILILKSK